ncbi:MAG: hypothetical protein OMM_07571 [Candidatus Magnetoglobus multicellularis str. Araruama]|uniref:Uncharacterized protein n=1 Tax=Candidatus Magnetoglobus multicellularis str. Araruama TaxID=890399 RepID=A0A1V1PCA2_9BACT|nr:MAG: hypothetical protein OMM_07571 [Candidatus Magnetoglobus multicellularis str. Araruama]
MKIRTIEICISLMIILCVGFILFFVAHQLAKKQDRLSTAEKNQISDTKSIETEQVNHQNAPDKVVLEPQSVTPITRKVVPDSQADSHIKRKPQTVSQPGDQPGANTEKDVSSNRTISTKKNRHHCQIPLKQSPK